MSIIILEYQVSGGVYVGCGYAGVFVGERLLIDGYAGGKGRHKFEECCKELGD